MTTQAGGNGAAHNPTIRTSQESPELVALRAKVDKLRAHLEGAEAALAKAEKENR